MSLLSSSHVHFNDCDNLTGFDGRGGHPDECTAIIADPGPRDWSDRDPAFAPYDWPSPEDEALMREIELDQAVSMAESHLREQMEAATRMIRDAFPSAWAIGVTTTHRLCDTGYQIEFGVEYHAVLCRAPNDAITGKADDPISAARALLAMVPAAA